jgi:hypothetical protein
VSTPQVFRGGRGRNHTQIEWDGQGVVELEAANARAQRAAVVPIHQNHPATGQADLDCPPQLIERNPMLGP